jgi:hypothetical protein
MKHWKILLRQIGGQRKEVFLDGEWKNVIKEIQCDFPNCEVVQAQYLGVY